ncbi:MAG: alpha/beta fold hydrolase [Gemmatimonadetes bacterium]|nr:alpha/beta fold hydrolase [Gemmatimonadota bacterium]
MELVGGPGNAATDFARQFVEELTYIRETHDVLLVDQRGTGGSNPLYCEELALHQVSSLPPRFPPAAVDRCRARLSALAALDHYTTADAAEDLEAVRQALGYERLNLFGSSYGTRVVLEYLRRFSDHARSAMLWGVVPPDFQRPLWYPRDGQAAFDRLVADCAYDAACRRAFPAIADDLPRTARPPGHEARTVPADGSARNARSPPASHPPASRRRSGVHWRSRTAPGNSPGSFMRRRGATLPHCAHLTSPSGRRDAGTTTACTCRSCAAKRSCTALRTDRRGQRRVVHECGAWAGVSGGVCGGGRSRARIRRPRPPWCRASRRSSSLARWIRSRRRAGGATPRRRW